MKLKKKEFLSLTQGNMAVSEYRDRFTQLSRYAPKEVDTDEKHQERFLEGLIGPLNYQLQSHTFPNFQTLLNKAISLESKRRILTVGVSRPGVPEPTSEVSPRAPAQMGRGKVAGDGRERGGNPAAFVFVPCPGRVRLQ
jgi:hypothetical protein